MAVKGKGRAKRKLDFTATSDNLAEEDFEEVQGDCHDNSAKKVNKAMKRKSRKDMIVYDSLSTRGKIIFWQDLDNQMKNFDRSQTDLPGRKYRKKQNRKWVHSKFYWQRHDHNCHN